MVDLRLMELQIASPRLFREKLRDNEAATVLELNAAPEVPSAVVSSLDAHTAWSMLASMRAAASTDAAGLRALLSSRPDITLAVLHMQRDLCMLRAPTAPEPVPVPAPAAPAALLPAPLLPAPLPPAPPLLPAPLLPTPLLPTPAPQLLQAVAAAVPTSSSVMPAAAPPTLQPAAATEAPAAPVVVDPRRAPRAAPVDPRRRAKQ